MIHSDGLYRPQVHRGQDGPHPSTMLQEYSRLPGLEHDLRLQGLKRVPVHTATFTSIFFHHFHSLIITQRWILSLLHEYQLGRIVGTARIKQAY